MERDIISLPQLQCPICASQGSLLYKDLEDRIYQNKGNWDMRTCPKCGLLWLDPYPCKEEIWKAYTSYYTHIGEDKANIFPFLRSLEQAFVNLHFHYPSKDSFLKRLAARLIYLFPTEKAEIEMRYFYLDGRKKGRVLDVGCGSGATLLRLKEKGWQVEGIDFDKAAIDGCNNLGLKASVSDLFSMKYEDNSFDVIYLNHVIEHLFDSVLVVKECLRILKKGGELIMATPNTDSWTFKHIFKTKYFYLHTPAHINLFNRKSLEQLMNRGGFVDVKSRTTVRNGHWVFACSWQICRKGHFNFGSEKPPKLFLLIGKFVQMGSWLLLGFCKNIGTEVLVRGTKAE